MNGQPENSTPAHVQTSNRWIGFLLLGIVGSAAGGIIITIIASFGVLFTAGPFAATGATMSGLAFSLTIIPIYALVSAGAGLSMAKGRAMTVHEVIPLTEGDLKERVHRIARNAGLTSMPEVGVYKSPDMNAFATGSGRNNSLIAFSTALLDQMTPDEVEAVAGHEIGHIASNDMMASCIINSIQNAMSWYMMFRGLRMFVRRLIFFISEIGAAALSRSREFRADAISAKLVGAPKMIAALERLSGDTAKMPPAQYGYARMKVSDNVLRTHPPIKDRIHALESAKYGHRANAIPEQARANEAFMG